MKILHVLRTLDPAWGGPVEGARNLVSQALLRGYSAEVVCADDAASPWLGGWNSKIHAVGPGLLKYGFTTRLDRWLAENLTRFDVVVVHGIWMYLSYAVWKATRRTAVPYYLFIHGALDPWFRKQYPVKHVKKAIYWKALEHKVVRDAEKVLFTTCEEMVLADRSFLPYQCRAEITGYGIVRPSLPDNFNKKRTVEELTQIYPDLRNRNFLLFLARLHEKKGIDLLLKAFAASRSVLRDTALVIAGPGDTATEGNMRKLVSSLGIDGDVIWTGPLYGEAKWNALQAADAYILPSHQENFGISVVEALACGTPVLISDKVNIRREIEAAACGLVASDDIEGTTWMLKRWSAMMPDERARMKTRAGACFESQFDIAVTSERYFRLLHPYAGKRIPSSFPRHETVEIPPAEVVGRH